MERTDRTSATIIISSTLVAFFSGFMLGVYSIRGYLISPDMIKEREDFWKDPVESEASDIDEDDTILDHAPNWANGEEADRRQGLRQRKDVVKPKKVVVREVKEKKKAAVAEDKDGADPNEECKLVLVVRTDLGMTKGRSHVLCDSVYRTYPFVTELTKQFVYRQDRSAMRPRNVSMLQDASQREPRRAHRRSGQAPKTVGGPRPSQDRGADQE
jgi:hypothetical protein